MPAEAHLLFNPLTRAADFSWDTRLASPSQPGSDHDKVNIVCFNTARPREVHALGRVTRAAGKASVELPGEWQPATTHFWVYLTSPDLQDNSNSIYLKPG